MSHEDRDDPLDPRLEQVRRQVAQLPSVEADPQFRARLRADFASGALEQEAPAARARGFPRATRALGLRWGVGLAAAAGLVLLLDGVNRGPAWTVVTATGPANLQVDGHSIPMAEVSARRPALRPGARIQVPAGAELTLMSAGTVLLQAAPNTELLLPGPPGRWWGRHARGRLLAGEVRFTTGDRFAGAALEMTTPEAMVEVTGTTFALIALPCVTCLCVYEGQVMLRPLGGPGQAVSAPGRKMVFSDGRPAVVGQLEPAERQKLGMVRDAGQKLLHGGKDASAEPTGGALEFDLPRHDGGRVRLSDLRRNGPVVVDFWATWCAPCKRALPRYQQLQDRYAAQGVTFVAISEDDPRSQDKIAPYAQAAGLTFPVLLDGDGKVARQFGVSDLPTTFVISSHGQVVTKALGYKDGDEGELERVLRAQLGLPEAPAPTGGG